MNRYENRFKELSDEPIQTHQCPRCLGKLTEELHGEFCVKCGYTNNDMREYQY